MTTTREALDHIRSMQPDLFNFIAHGRGYVDWKFSQVCAYMGYTKAREYAESMRRWHDFSSKYSDCLLERTYADFVAADQNHTTTCTT